MSNINNVECCLFFVTSLLVSCMVSETPVYVAGREQSDSSPTVEASKYSRTKNSRYLLYDVNPGEGFNLRRDVYLRMANLVKLLNEAEPWILVLPPWNRLYHWRSDLDQENLPWSLFFDIESLGRHIPVMEFKEFLNVAENMVEEVIYFQHFKEGWKDTGWVERMEERDCLNQHPFYKDTEGLWHWYMPNVAAQSFKCMSIQAEYSFLKDFLFKNCTSRSVFFPRAEQVMHGSYSEWSVEFWTARRSVRFSKALRALGDEFRKQYLNSNDVEDKTILEENWKYMKRKHGDAYGGPYIGVHLRRRDFLYSHKEDIPSISGAAQQIMNAMKKLNVAKVFVATDAPQKEFEQLKKDIQIGEVYRYNPSEKVLQTYMDGGLAIIDQWICAHARYFIGTYTSTFSFRIHEEREIFGFSPNSTYNSFCPDGNPACEQPTNWLVKYKK